MDESSSITQEASTRPILEAMCVIVTSWLSSSLSCVSGSVSDRNSWKAASALFIERLCPQTWNMRCYTLPCHVCYYLSPIPTPPLLLGVHGLLE